MKELKHVLGVDVAQKELVVTLGKMYEDFSISLYAYKVFRNSESGILSLINWVQKLLKDEASKVHYVMEATGVYHQKFAYYLNDNGFKVSVVLPNKISNYIRTLELKTITDKTCSEAIARFGLERKLEYWIKPKDAYRELQQLTRERDQIVNERVVVKNQLHAEQSEAIPNLKSIGRLQLRINFLNGQEKEIKLDIAEIVKANAELIAEIERMTSIPGIGALTAVIILAETNGFELIRNKKQLVSYVGLDVKEKQSGTSIKGKPRISKRGNRSIRKAMYFPAMSAVKWDDHYRESYARLVSKQGIKMKALVSIQRKLLEMTYILYKNKTTYEKQYKNSVQTQMA
jgi:transposase